MSAFVRPSEVRRAIVAGDNRLAIDQERRGLDAGSRLNVGREAIGSNALISARAFDMRQMVRRLSVDALPPNLSPAPPVVNDHGRRWPHLS